MNLLAGKKAISIRLDAGTQQQVKGDQAILERVLINLLTNAIKFSPLRSEIRIELSNEENNQVVFSVIDEGSGIPEDQLDKVFEKFSQLKARDSGGIKSTGLGLAFCKMAVEAHHGSIGIVNNSEQGATVRFSVPAAASAPALFEALITTNQDQSISLSEHADRQYLLPFVLELKQVPFYKNTQIRALTQVIDTDFSVGVSAWVNALNHAIYSNDEATWQQLMEEVTGNTSS